MKKKELLKKKVSRSPEAKQAEAGRLPTPKFTKALAAEIVKNLTSITQWATKKSHAPEAPEADRPKVHNPIIVDSSVLIDGRIVPIVNSGFFSGTLIMPQFVLSEVQHIADSPDPLRRAKGRRGLDVANKLKDQKVNPMVATSIMTSDVPDMKEVDHKLLAYAARNNVRLLTVDFNLAQLARAQGVKVLNINDLAQALKVAIIPGEELSIKITHEGKERAQGVGYLADGTMVVVEDTRDKVGQDVAILVTKVHQTPAGQLFFARPKI